MSTRTSPDDFQSNGISLTYLIQKLWPVAGPQSCHRSNQSFLYLIIWINFVKGANPEYLNLPLWVLCISQHWFKAWCDCDCAVCIMAVNFSPQRILVGRLNPANERSILVTNSWFSSKHFSTKIYVYQLTLLTN